MPAFSSLIMGATAAVGLGLQVAGSKKQVDASQQAAAAQTQMIKDQQAIEAQRNQLMQLEAKRKQMELVRSAQKSRSMSLATASNQGAQFGSGLQGAYGETSGQFNTQELAVGQNLQIGNNIFGLNANVSQDKIALAQAQGQAAIGAGLSSLGGSLVSSAGLIGKIGAGAFGSPSPSKTA